jgi:hypothetical protein
LGCSRQCIRRHAAVRASNAPAGASLSRPRTPLTQRGVNVAWSKNNAYADTEDTTSIQILTFDAVGHPGEIVAALDCDTGDGMGSCPVETLVAADTATAVADAFDSAVLEATAEATADAAEPAIQPVAAIVVTGDAAIEGPATAAIPAPAAETATEDETTGEAPPVLPRKDRLGEASAAVVVEVTQSSTVVVPGQAAEDKPVVTGSITEPSSTTPVSLLDGKNGDEDF